MGRKRGLICEYLREEEVEGGSRVDLSRRQVDLSILNFCKSLVWNVKMIDGRDRVDSRMWVVGGKE